MARKRYRSAGIPTESSSERKKNENPFLRSKTIKRGLGSSVARKIIIGTRIRPGEREENVLMLS